MAASETEIGAIYVRTGLLLAGDGMVFDEEWRRAATASSGWVVDLRGPDAETVANRSGAKREKLVDGTWRLHCGDSMRANVEASMARRQADQNDLKLKIRAHPIDASSEVARDACRKSGVGMVFAGKPAYLACSTEGHGYVSVRERRGVDGKLKAIVFAFGNE